MAFDVLSDAKAGEMRRTIKFDGEFLWWTIEIKNVIADGMLPAEFAAFEFRILYYLPECGLGGCEDFP